MSNAIYIVAISGHEMAWPVHLCAFLDQEEAKKEADRLEAASQPLREATQRTYLKRQELEAQEIYEALHPELIPLYDEEYRERERLHDAEGISLFASSHEPINDERQPRFDVLSLPLRGTYEAAGYVLALGEVAVCLDDCPPGHCACDDGDARTVNRTHSADAARGDA